MSMVLICYCVNLSWAEIESEKVVSDAKAWLSLIDNGNYSDSWKDASSYFQAAVSEQNWGNSLSAVRKPLGKLKSRNLLGSQASNSLPGAPDGKYLVMSFETAFEHKISAIETVTFMRDTDGHWKAAGYYIK